MIKFKAMFNTITQVEVERETEKMVVISFPNGGSQKELKVSSYYSYWDTWDEAKNHLIEKAERIVNKKQVDLQKAEENLERVMQLRQKAQENTNNNDAGEDVY